MCIAVLFFKNLHLVFHNIYYNLSQLQENRVLRYQFSIKRRVENQEKTEIPLKRDLYTFLKIQKPVKSHLKPKGTLGNVKEKRARQASRA